MNDDLIELRSTILELNYIAKEGHLASSYSVLEIIYSLYSSGRIKLGKEQSGHFVLSKGHAALALYAVLQKFGFVTKDELYAYCQEGSLFAGHPNHKICGITFSTGSLGHGVNYAVGLALALKAKRNNEKVYCLVGDGEMNEGTLWESLLIVEQHKLDNFVLIIDNNYSTERCLTVFDLEQKLSSFNMDVQTCNGNDLSEIEKSLRRIKSGRVCAIVANTIKGFGIKVMENSYEWHHKAPSAEEYRIFIRELNQQRESL